MKRNLQSIMAILGLSVVFSVQSAELPIQEVEYADFAELAEEAAAENKQLMVVYYQEQCDACQQLVGMKDKDNASIATIEKSYKIYKTNVAGGFNVVCPSGETLSENEFLYVKNISSLPAVVITDKFGNVEVVENDITTAKQLLAVGDNYKSQVVVKNSQ